VNHVVEEKNNLLSDPLEPKEVEAILNADMYPITCKYIRTHLPYVSCKRCPMNKEDDKIDFDGVLSNKKLNTRDIKVAYALLYGYRTVGSIVKKTGYTKQEVYNSLMKLKRVLKRIKSIFRKLFFCTPCEKNLNYFHALSYNLFLAKKM